MKMSINKNMLLILRITYTCPVGHVIDLPNRDDEQPEFVPLLQETFDVMCGDDATWVPLAPGGGTAMPSCIRKFLIKICTDSNHSMFFFVFLAINCTSPPFPPPQNDLGMYNWTETGSNPRPYASIIRYWCPRSHKIKFFLL
jgi:hypothetical protein